MLKSCTGAVRMSSLKARMVKGSVLNLVAVVFSQGSTLIVNIIVARILMQQIFGEYAMVQNTLLTAATLAQLATGNTALKHVAEYRHNNPEKAGRVIGLCAIVSTSMAALMVILLAVTSPWLAGGMLQAPHLSTSFLLGAGFLFFSAVNGYQTGTLSGMEAYGCLAKAGILSGIVAITAIPVGALLGGLNGTLIGLSSSALLRYVIHYFWLQRVCREQGIVPRYRGVMSQEKVLILRFALPIAISQCFSLPMLWLANSLLVRQPGGYGEMALYSAANTIRSIVLFLPSVMSSVGLSVLSNEISKGDMSHYHRVFKANVFYIFLISLFGVLFVGLLGPSILQLFGKEFRTGELILWLLLISSVFESLTVALYQYVLANTQIWVQFLGIVVPREIFLVIVTYFLVKTHGGTGLAIAYVSSTFIGLLLHVLLVARIFKVKKRVIVV